MHGVMEARTSRNAVPDIAPFNLVSENKKLGIWLDRLIADSNSKGKPTAHVVKLTPELAKILLDRNADNRKVNESAVERYAYEIDGGRWAFNGEPIIVAADGSLNDGQHRSLAVVRADKPIDVVMIVGVERETRTTLDQGRMRSAGDYLAMEGHTNTINLATAAQYAWQYLTYGRINPKGSRATKSEIISFVASHPSLQRSVSLFEMKKTRYLGGHAVFAFCHFAIGQIGRREDVDQFFFAMIEGSNLPKGDPALYARNRLLLMTGSREQNAKAELIFRCWNAFRKGEVVSRFHLSDAVLPVLEA